MKSAAGRTASKTSPLKDRGPHRGTKTNFAALQSRCSVLVIAGELGQISPHLSRRRSAEFTAHPPVSRDGDEWSQKTRVRPHMQNQRVGPLVASQVYNRQVKPPTALCRTALAAFVSQSIEDMRNRRAWLGERPLRLVDSDLGRGRGRMSNSRSCPAQAVSKNRYALTLTFHCGIAMKMTQLTTQEPVRPSARRARHGTTQ